MKVLVTAILSLLVGMTGNVQASLITNGDFNTDLSGWTYLPWVNSSWGGSVWLPDQGGCVGVWGDGAEGGYLYQDNVSHPFGAGETLDVSFSLAWLGSGHPDVAVTLFDTTPAIPEAVASLTVNDNQIGATFAPFNFSYVVEPSRVGHTWRLDFNPIQWGGWTGVDQVSVVASAVPEPSVAACLSTILVGLLARRNRTR